MFIRPIRSAGSLCSLTSAVIRDNGYIPTCNRTWQVGLPAWNLRSGEPCRAAAEISICSGMAAGAASPALRAAAVQAPSVPRHRAAGPAAVKGLDPAASRSLAPSGSCSPISRELGVSRYSVARIWREYGVRPWRVEP
jgi:hypothetical protein